MSLLDFWRLASQLAFLTVSATTLYNWIKFRDQTRFDIAMVFLVFAVAILGQYLQNVFHIVNPWLLAVIAVAVLLQPYLLLRIVRYFKPIRRWIMLAAFIGFLTVGIFYAVAVAPLAPGTPAPPPVVAVLILYLVIVGGYVTFLLIQGTMIIPGITGKRLFFASLGSGAVVALFLIAFLLIIFGGTNLPEPWKTVNGVSLQLLVIVSAVSYFLGFSPPRGLVQSWQHRELHLFLKLFSQNPSHSEEPDFLASSAVRTVGGAAALVLLYDKEGGLFRNASVGAWDQNHEPFLTRVWSDRVPRTFQVPKETSESGVLAWAQGFKAQYLYVLPLQTPAQRWGLLLVALRYSPLFGQDDLDLLALFCEQSALKMDNSALLKELEGLNQDLKARVAEQAQQTLRLEYANKELEAFSYSVSHDLRAPLRGINGWSNALLEDYGSTLDETAKEYLSRVRGEADYMGQLIDDLLQLSQVSRSELQVLSVDLSEISARVMSRVRESWPGRRIDFKVQPGLKVACDPRLMEIVFTNLLDNACKFTKTRDLARIEFGLTDLDGEQTFFLSDNGVGYDMKYSNKLFGVFQRMHEASAFPGTGIGLAIVKRVIERHNGKIWAVGKVEEGATFYFHFRGHV